MERRKVATGTRWEPIVGYSRRGARRLRGARLGTTATDPDGRIVGVGDAYVQATQTLRNIRAALARRRGADRGRGAHPAST